MRTSIVVLITQIQNIEMRLQNFSTQMKMAISSLGINFMTLNILKLEFLIFFEFIIS